MSCGQNPRIFSPHLAYILCCLWHLDTSVSMMPSLLTASQFPFQPLSDPFFNVCVPHPLCCLVCALSLGDRVSFSSSSTPYTLIPKSFIQNPDLCVSAAVGAVLLEYLKYFPGSSCPKCGHHFPSQAHGCVVSLRRAPASSLEASPHLCLLLCVSASGSWLSCTLRLGSPLPHRVPGVCVPVHAASLAAPHPGCTCAELLLSIFSRVAHLI